MLKGNGVSFLELTKSAMLRKIYRIRTDELLLVFRNRIVLVLKKDVYKRQVVYVSDHSTVVIAEAISRKT